MGQSTQKTLEEFQTDQFASAQQLLTEIGKVPSEAIEMKTININEKLKELDGGRIFLDDQKSNYVCQITITNPSPPLQTEPLKPIVMIHGFGGSGCMFYKLAGSLLPYCSSITTVDLLGMGCSGRPEMDKKRTGTFEAGLEFFILSLKAWLQESKFMEKNPSFILLGHSLGGFISAKYAQRFPDGIDSLYLLSPIGVPRSFELNDKSLVKTAHDDEIEQPKSIFGKISESAKKSMWNSKVNPMKLANLRGALPGSSKSQLVEEYIQQRMIVGNPVEIEALKKFISLTVFDQQENSSSSSEGLITYLLDYSKFAQKAPLYRDMTADAEEAREDAIPTYLLYGDDDWVWRQAFRARYQHLEYISGHFSPQEFCKVNQMGEEVQPSEKKLLLLKDITISERAGHHLYIDNHLRTASYFLAAAMGQEEVADAFLVENQYDF